MIEKAKADIEKEWKQAQQEVQGGDCELVIYRQRKIIETGEAHTIKASSNNAKVLYRLNISRSDVEEAHKIFTKAPFLLETLDKSSCFRGSERGSA